MSDDYLEGDGDDEEQNPALAARRRAARTSWWCRWFGHRMLGTKALGGHEHICTYDYCLRCDMIETVHLTGPWPHTCEERLGEQPELVVVAGVEPRDGEVLVLVGDDVVPRWLPAWMLEGP